MSDPTTIEEEIIRLVEEARVFTDIKIHEGSELLWKLPSGWEPTGFGQVSSQQIEQFMARLNKDWEYELGKGLFERTVEFDNCRVRCNGFTTNARKRKAIMLRKHPLTPPALNTLQVPKAIVDALGYAKGLLLITGTMGAGKTTTISSMAEYMLLNRAIHVETIEDPIEFLLAEGRGTVSQKEVPHDSDTFNYGLREALRQKPDAIVVGEIRDRDTAETVWMAMECGPLVIASTHANGVEGAIAKLLSYFPTAERDARLRKLSLYLVGIIHQSMIPTMDGMDFAMATEVLCNGPAVAEHLANANFVGLRDTMLKEADQVSRHLNIDLAALYTKRIIDKREAIRGTYEPFTLAAKLQSIPSHMSSPA